MKLTVILSQTILFSSGKSAENNVLSALQDLAERFALSRKLLREVGVSADVPIEPKEQTALLDFTLQVFTTLSSFLLCRTHHNWPRCLA